MDVNIILKDYLQQKQVNIFPADIQCLQYGHLMVQHDVYRSEDCMRKFQEFLREHTMKVINCEKMKMKPLT